MHQMHGGEARRRGMRGRVVREAAGMLGGWGLAAWRARWRLDGGVRCVGVQGVALGRDGAGGVLRRAGC